MKADSQIVLSPLPERVTSIDFFRGLTMFLLAGEASRLYSQFDKFDSGIMLFLVLSSVTMNGMDYISGI